MTVKEHIRELALVYGWHQDSSHGYRQNFSNDNGEILSVYHRQKSTFKNPWISVVSHCYKSTRMTFNQYENFIKTQLIYKMEYNDETPMPFGKHKGEKLANVPDSYLKWLGDKLVDDSKVRALNETERKLRNYIDANFNS